MAHPFEAVRGTVGTVRVGGTPCWLATPTTVTQPPVILFPHRDGVDGFIADIADLLVASGIPVLAPDLFDHLPAGLTPEQRKRTLVDGDMIALGGLAVAVLTDRFAGAPAALGFCLGGRLAFLAAVTVAGIGRACGCYGGEIDRGWGAARSPIELVAPGVPPTQLHRGSRDSNATAQAQDAAVAAFDAAGGYLQAHTYAGARHAFANPRNPERFHPRATAAVLRGALSFLTETAFLAESAPGPVGPPAAQPAFLVAPGASGAGRTDREGD